MGCRKGQGNMTIPDTNVTLEELLDRTSLAVQYVDKDGFLPYLNKAAAARPANIKREVGINIRNCHAKPESLEMIERNQRVHSMNGSMLFRQRYLDRASRNGERATRIASTIEPGHSKAENVLRRSTVNIA
jgi:hypothetical protein